MGVCLGVCCSLFAIVSCMVCVVWCLVLVNCCWLVYGVARCSPLVVVSCLMLFWCVVGVCRLLVVEVYCSLRWLMLSGVKCLFRFLMVVVVCCLLVMSFVAGVRCLLCVCCFFLFN